MGRHLVMPAEPGPRPHRYSVVIPVFNEQERIGILLSDLRERVATEIDIEIIVVDNHSTDNSLAIASEYADRVLREHGSVAHLRNAGASKANGTILVFLDSDISLDREWERQLVVTTADQTLGDEYITGSWVRVPADASFLERLWFRPLEDLPHSHVNSAHMIIPRQFYLRLGGFSEDLVSGEDSDLCFRAERAGGVVAERRSLVAYHHGYPKTVRDFFRREIWHGLGDFTSLAHVLRSPVALVSMFVLTLLLLAFATLSFTNLPKLAGLTFLGACGLICCAAAVRRYPDMKFRYLPIYAYLFLVYFSARGTALFVSVIRRSLGPRLSRWKSM